MGTPIVVQPRRNEFGQLLGHLLIQKIAHKQEMEREKLRIDASKAQLKETREYEESKEATKVTRGTPYTGKYGRRRTPVYMGGQYIGEEVGGEIYINETPEQKLARAKELAKYKSGLPSKKKTETKFQAKKKLFKDPKTGKPIPPPKPIWASKKDFATIKISPIFV